MRIGIEATGLLIAKKTGIQHYVTSLIQSILEVLPDFPDLELFLYAHTGNKYIDNTLIKDLVPATEIATVRTWHLRRGYRFGLPVMALLDRVKLLHLPIPQKLRIKPCRVLVTFHDASWAKLPQEGQEVEGRHVRPSVEAAITQGDHYITVSESAGHDLSELYQISNGKISVVHHGVAKEFFHSTGDIQVRKQFELDSYILHVGTLQFRKNLVRLIKAFDRLKREKRIPHKLVLAGPGGWGEEDIRKIVDDLDLHEHVLFPGYIPSEDLPILFARADLYVYPSLYEGFGIPLLEAMASGTVVVASDIPSLREVADDAALYFDPLEIDDMASMIYTALTDNGLREKMLEKGRQRVQDFTWRNAADKTLQIYQKVVG